MKHSLRIIPLLLSLLIFAGCVTTQSLINYDLEVVYDKALTKVQRPTDTQERWGDFNITKANANSVGNETVTKYSYVDSLISAIWYVGEKALFVEVENLSNHLIKINWNSAVYIDTSGTSIDIIHAGVRYADMGRSLPPTVIPAGTHTEITIYPTDYISYGTYTGWSHSPLISPNSILGNGVSKSLKRRNRKMIQNNVGRTFSVLLPIVVEGTTNPYTFTFTITDLHIEGKGTKTNSTL